MLIIKCIMEHLNNIMFCKAYVIIYTDIALKQAELFQWCMVNLSDTKYVNEHLVLRLYLPLKEFVNVCEPFTWPVDTRLYTE